MASPRIRHTFIALAVGVGLLLTGCSSTPDGQAGATPPASTVAAATAPSEARTSPAVDPTTDGRRPTSLDELGVGGGVGTDEETRPQLSDLEIAIAPVTTPVPVTSAPAPTTTPAPTSADDPATTAPATTAPATTAPKTTAPTTTAPVTTEPPVEPTDDGAPRTQNLVITCDACGEGPVFSDTVYRLPEDFPGNVGAVGFTTPSGNISCAFSDDGSGVACQIGEHTYETPADVDCHGGGDEGAAVELGSSGAQFLCAGDYFTGGPTLDYGQSLAVGDYGCASRETGVQCIHFTNGNTFILSKDFYQFG